MALIDDMAASLRNVTQELAIEISARYTGSQLRYPTEARRYERDMQEVYVARRLIEEYEAARGIQDPALELAKPDAVSVDLAAIRPTFFD